MGTFASESGTRTMILVFAGSVLSCVAPALVTRGSRERDAGAVPRGERVGLLAVQH